VALVMPALFSLAVPERALAIEPLSVWVATLLLVLYFAYLYFLLHTHKHLYTEEIAHAPTWSVSRSVITLLIATLAIAWVSEILVGAIEPLVVGLGWSQMFIGVVFVAIIGNAAEHFSAVTVARKQRMDLSLQISIGSATQIALLVAPLLVLLSLVIGTPMNLIFDAFELVAIIFSVLIVNFAVADGESNWLEGAQLLAAYAILAVVFFLHP
jgi:Ca2+:H+ antiporter